MERKGALCCFLLFLSLTPVSLIPVDSDGGEWQTQPPRRPNTGPRPPQPRPTLVNLNQLSRIDFGHHFPLHGLNLLYWLASTLTIHDNSDAMTVNFNPRQGAFGSHHFANAQELLLVDPQYGYDFYTLGNINTRTYPNAANLPSHVRRNYNPPARNVPQDFYNLRNLDRVIVRVNRDGNKIDMVFISQHPDSMTAAYRAQSTYRVSKDLLRQIRGYATIQAFRQAVGYAS